MSEHQPFIEAALAAAGFTPNEDDVRQLALMYPSLLESVRQLYAIAELEGEGSALDLSQAFGP